MLRRTAALVSLASVTLVLPAAAFRAAPAPGRQARSGPAAVAASCESPPSPSPSPSHGAQRQSRRQALCLAAGAALPLTLAAGGGPAAAFDNAVPEYSKYAKKPKRRGDAPKDLGVARRTVNADSIDADPRSFEGLRACDGKCNCFSTTGDDLLEDRIQRGADTLIPLWLPPADDPEPFQSLVAQVKAYEPGQGLVDGGGFAVVKETDSYLYVQFEALKKGYIDDVEFFMAKDRKVQVRSGSRVGSSDFGVNAKRLNFIAARLRDQGWTISEITAETHPDYFYAAADAADQTFDQDRRKGTAVENARLARPNFGNRAVLK